MWFLKFSYKKSVLDPLKGWNLFGYKQSIEHDIGSGKLQSWAQPAIPADQLMSVPANISWYGKYKMINAI